MRVAGYLTLLWDATSGLYIGQTPLAMKGKEGVQTQRASRCWNARKLLSLRVCRRLQPGQPFNYSPERSVISPLLYTVVSPLCVCKPTVFVSLLCV